MDDDYDTPWKDVITDHFPEFMAFYFPSAYAAIDWSRPHDFLDQELSALSRDAGLGRRLLDKLVRVYLHQGGEQTKHKPHQRRRAKWRLKKLLYQRDWDKRRIINLHRAIDWLMRLPKSLDKRLRYGILQLERRKAMPYVTSYERIGMEIGRNKGLQEGLQRGQQIGLQVGMQAGRQAGLQEGWAGVLVAQLSKRFGTLSPEVAARLANADVTQLSRWALNFVDAGSLDQVFRD